MVEPVLNVEPKLSVQILFEGAQEVLGAARMQEVRNWLPPSERQPSLAEETDQFLYVLEEMFGQPAVHGLALRIGRATFPYWLKHMGKRLGFRDREFRLLPALRRIDAGLQALAGVMKEWYGEAVVLSDGGSYWQWQVVDQFQHHSASACFLKVGLLQAFACWAGGGRFYPVTLTECCVDGSPTCTYRIEKKPLD